MKNLTPAARAASSACCVPSTLTRQRRRPALVSGTSAAWWCTTSTPAIASATRAASRMSARRYSMPAGSSGAGRMSSTRTRSARAWSAHAVWAPRNPAPPVTRWVAIAALLDRLPVLEAPADRAPHALLQLDPRIVAQLALGARDRAGDRLAHLREDVDLLLVAPHRLEERVGDSRHPARQRREAEPPVRDRHAELLLEQALHRVDDLAHRVGAPVGDPVEAPARRAVPPPTSGALPSRIMLKKRVCRAGCSGP